MKRVAMLAAALAAAQPAPPVPPPANQRVEAPLAQGGSWLAEVPPRWNGTVLLFSHGYAAGPANPARDGPRGGGELLLARGYALLGGSYRETGWALATAVPDQIAALDAFAARFGRPRRALAWGESMGGLVAAALVERYPDRIDGAMPMCASLAGVLGMENQALDAAWALRTLVATSAPPRITGIWSPGSPAPPGPREDGAAVDALVAAAMATPLGRARLALAASLAQLPDRADDRPVPDADAQVAAWSRWIAVGAFFPRWDQERRAGGNASWNTGVDYRAQLAASGRRRLVASLYARAGGSLAADLAVLASAPRIAADPRAVAYMRANFVPTGRLRRPVLTLHTIGDGMTMVTYEQAYAAAVGHAGAAALLRQAFVDAPGHCAFTPAETVAGIVALDRRVATGAWQGADAAGLNRTARGIGTARFVASTPARFLRPCGARAGSCPGEPRPPR